MEKEQKTFAVEISFLQPVELRGFIEASSAEEVRETLKEKGKEQGHISLKIIRVEEVTELPPIGNVIDITPTVLN